MADATWRWFASAYEAMATGRVNLGSGGVAHLSSAALTDESGADGLIDRVRPVTLQNSRVARVGGETRWRFDDLQFGPGATADGIRGVVVLVGGTPVAYLPLGGARDVVDGVFTVVVDPDAVLTLGNRS